MKTKPVYIMKGISLLTAMLMLIVSGLTAQDLKMDMGDSIKVIEEGPEMQTDRSVHMRSPAPTPSGFVALTSIGFETVDPFHTTWDKTPWPDEQVNFPPTGRSLPAGDLTGDGNPDFYRTYTNVADERDSDYEATTDKTLLFWGEDKGTEPDLIVYEELYPVGDLNGDGQSNAVAYEEHTETWYLYTFGDDDYERESFSHEFFSQNPDIRFSLTPHFDLNDSGHDDLIGVVDDHLHIMYGDDEPFEDLEMGSQDLPQWASEHNVVFEAAEMADVFEYEGEKYALLGIRNEFPDRYWHAFIISAEDELQVQQAFQYTIEEEFSFPGSLQARKLVQDELPYLIWSWTLENQTFLFSPSDDEDQLFSKERIEWFDHAADPVGDLTGNDETEFIFQDEEGTTRFVSMADDPKDEPEPGDVVWDEDDANIEIPFSPLNQPFGDLTGNDHNDLLLAVSTDDEFGQILVEGDADRDFDILELTYDEADYARTVRDFTYNLGDISGNGVDDFAVVVERPENVDIEIFHGGNGVTSPDQVIETDFTSIVGMDTGAYSDQDRVDLAVLGRNPVEEDGQLARNESEVHLFEGGEQIADTPYMIIGEQDAHPDIDEEFQEAVSPFLGTMITAGDVNNSGYDDLLIGAPAQGSLPVVLYEGGTDLSEQPDHEISYVDPNGYGQQFYGNTMHAVGDISGNGVDDFIIVDPAEVISDGEIFSEGAAYIFHGQDQEDGDVSFEEADLTLITNQEGVQEGNRYWIYGMSDMAVGDFNGNGHNDLAIQSFRHHEDGNIDNGKPGIHIYHGGSDMDSQPDHMVGLFNDIMAIGEHTGGYTSYMGHALMEAIPDLDGSGHDELLVIGGSFYTNAVLLEGSDDSVVEEPAAVFEAPLQHVDMGVGGNFINIQFKATVGDYTGDGFKDFAVTQPDDRNYRDTPLHLFTTGDVSIAQEFDFRTDIRAEDEAENATELTFGTSSEATDATDGIDQTAPPPPPGESFDARIVTGDDEYIRFFRPTTELENEWEVQVQTGEDNYPVTLSWDADELYEEGDFTIHNETGNADLDMREEENYTIEDAGESVLTITHSVLEAPEQVTLAAPEEDEAVEADSLVFTWQEAEPAVEEYEIELAGDENFDEIVVDSVVTDTSFVYRDLDQDGEYWWRVRAGNTEGWGEFSPARSLDWTYTHIAGREGVPEEYSLKDNYPNPFNPATQIRYDLPEGAQVRLEVYDILGRRVSTLVDEQQQAGRYEVTFDASNLASGTYIYRIEVSASNPDGVGAGEFVETRQMMLVK